MKLKTCCVVVALSLSNLSYASTMVSETTLVKPNYQFVTDSAATSDGGTIIGGFTDNGQFQNMDYWVAKLDNNNSIQWQKQLSANYNDEITSISQTADGGYLVAGSSPSIAGGDKTESSKGFSDYWIVKLDAAGNKLWDKTIGGNHYDELTTARETADGGYILSGSSRSPVSGDKTLGSFGGDDIWLVKLRADRTIEWQKVFGGTGNETGGALSPTADNGYIILSTSGSGATGNKTDSSRGNKDFWVFKVDANGNLQWQKTIGGSGEDLAAHVIQDRAGNYLIAGSSQSNQSFEKADNSWAGTHDYWLLKLSANGHILWQKTLGGTGLDIASDVIQTLDDGYIVAGRSGSAMNGNKTVSNALGINGSEDYWIIKYNEQGNQEWQLNAGAWQLDQLKSITQSNNGNYVLSGDSSSSAGGDKSQSSTLSDAWIVTAAEPIVGQSNFHFEDMFGKTKNIFQCIGWDIILNGAASKNETHYYIDAWKRPIGSTANFQYSATIGWEAGIVGKVNLTDKFASAGFSFAPGYEYQIKLAVQNLPHFNWVEALETFTVPSQQYHCAYPTEPVKMKL